MKNKFKLLISNKIRLIAFLFLTICTIFLTIVIPVEKHNDANIIDRGVVVIRGTSMDPTIADGQKPLLH